MSSSRSFGKRRGTTMSSDGSDTWSILVFAAKVGARRDLTVRPLPIEDVLLRELVVLVLPDLVPDVDHDRRDHALLGRVAGDGLRVAGDEAVRRVHVVALCSPIV